MNNDIKEDLTNLSSVLAYLMAKNSLTSSELARRTGITQPAIYRLSTGAIENPQILTLTPIATYFGITIDQLLGLSPLNTPRVINNKLLHDVTNKLITIKTVCSVLIEAMPGLIEGYEKAVDSNLIKETTSLDILPLLSVNISNLLKAANSIQELLSENARDSKEKL